MIEKDEEIVRIYGILESVSGSEFTAIGSRSDSCFSGLSSSLNSIIGRLNVSDTWDDQISFTVGTENVSGIDGMINGCRIPNDVVTCVIGSEVDGLKIAMKRYQDDVDKYNSTYEARSKINVGSEPSLSDYSNNSEYGEAHYAWSQRKATYDSYTDTLNRLKPQIDGEVTYIQTKISSIRSLMSPQGMYTGKAVVARYEYEDIRVGEINEDGDLSLLVGDREYIISGLISDGFLTEDDIIPGSYSEYFTEEGTLNDLAYRIFGDKIYGPEGNKYLQATKQFFENGTTITTIRKYLEEGKVKEVSKTVINDGMTIDTSIDMVDVDDDGVPDEGKPLSEKSVVSNIPKERQQDVVDAAVQGIGSESTVQTGQEEYKAEIVSTPESPKTNLAVQIGDVEEVATTNYDGGDHDWSSAQTVTVTDTEGNSYSSNTIKYHAFGGGDKEVELTVSTDNITGCFVTTEKDLDGNPQSIVTTETIRNSDGTYSERWDTKLFDREGNIVDHQTNITPVTPEVHTYVLTPKKGGTPVKITGCTGTVLGREALMHDVCQNLCGGNPNTNLNYGDVEIIMGNMDRKYLGGFFGALNFGRSIKVDGVVYNVTEE